MPAPVNTFKQSLAQGQRQIGCWVGLADSYAAEVMGTAGFDWLVIDGEHAPNDIRSLRDQLMALQSSDSHPVVRLTIGETWMVKQVLDIGAQTILVPMVESAEQARELVRACTYPPHGIRGVGSALTRSSQFSSISEYVTTADAQICLLVQVENRAGLAALDEILTVEGVDGVFIGPSDLAADMGYAGNAAAPEVQNAIADALNRIKAAGKAPGVLGVSETATQKYLEMGAQFLAVGIDVLILAQTARALAAHWKAK